MIQLYVYIYIHVYVHMLLTQLKKVGDSKGTAFQRRNNTVFLFNRNHPFKKATFRSKRCCQSPGGSKLREVLFVGQILYKQKHVKPTTFKKDWHILRSECTTFRKQYILNVPCTIQGSFQTDAACLQAK